MSELIAWLVLSIGGACFAGWALVDAVLDVRLLHALGIADMRLTVARRNVRAQAARFTVLTLWATLGALSIVPSMPRSVIVWGLVAATGIVTADSVADRLGARQSLRDLPRRKPPRADT